MKLEEIDWEGDTLYYCKKLEVYGNIVASHKDDGACLIMETVSGLDSMVYTEACNLEIAE